MLWLLSTAHTDWLKCCDIVNVVWESAFGTETGTISETRVVHSCAVCTGIRVGHLLAAGSLIMRCS